MLASSHPAKSKIKPRVKDVSDSWELLLSNCKDKKSRLQQAYQVQNCISMCITGMSARKTLGICQSFK